MGKIRVRRRHQKENLKSKNESKEPIWIRRPWYFWAAIVVVLAGAIGTGYLFLQASSPAGISASDKTNLPPASLADGCRTGDPMAGVYSPNRFKVIQPCQKVSGTVSKISPQKDGSYLLRIKPDFEYSSLLMSGNSIAGGDLIVAILCVNKTTNKVSEDACNLYQKPNITIPKVGDRIQVVGPYVEYLHSKWAEIHPAWNLTILH